MNDQATGLVDACANGDYAAAKHLIEVDGADVNMPNSIGVRPLLEASRNGKMPLVTLLVESGADVNLPSKYSYVSGRTLPGKISLHELATALPRGAAIRGDMVDDHIRTSFDTPLFIAVQNRHVAVAKYLIEKGADVNVRRDDGYTPLLRAVDNGDCDLVNFLIEKGANIQATCPDGATALFVGAQEGHLHIVELLIKAGMDVNARRSDGNGPLDMAEFNNHTPVVALLRQHGAKKRKWWEFWK